MPVGTPVPLHLPRHELKVRCEVIADVWRHHDGASLAGLRGVDATARCGASPPVNVEHLAVLANVLAPQLGHLAPAHPAPRGHQHEGFVTARAGSRRPARRPRPPTGSPVRACAGGFITRGMLHGLATIRPSVTAVSQIGMQQAVGMAVAAHLLGAELAQTKPAPISGVMFFSGTAPSAGRCGSQQGLVHRCGCGA